MLSLWPYILLALLLLVLVAAVAVYFVLRRARLRAGGAPKASALAPASADGSETPGLYSPVAAAGLRSSFGRAMRTLRAHVTRRGFRYRVPWFLMVGETGSGKTTALRDSGIGLAFGQPGGVKQGVDWFFFDGGVVLDVAGDIVLRPDGEVSNQSGWNQLARLLQRHRPERPLDGVVLTIPCTALLDTKGLDIKAASLYRKLWHAQKLLGMSFPVYVLVTKCDRLRGFSSLCRSLPEGAREEMFGWSSHYTLETAYRPEWVEEAFRNVHRYLFELQVEVLASDDGARSRDEVRDRDDLFQLPAKMREIKEPLQLYLDQIFKQSAFHDSFFFRGLYFCGDEGEGASLVRDAAPGAGALPGSWPEADEWLAGSPDPNDPLPPERGLSAQASGPVAPAPKVRPAFLKDLFEKKIFVEDMLARPLARAALSRNRTVLAAQVLSLAIPITGLVGLLFTYDGLKTESDYLYNMLVDESHDLNEVGRNRAPRVKGALYGDYSYAPSSYAPGPAVGDDYGRAAPRAVPAVLEARGGGAAYVRAQFQGDEAARPAPYGGAGGAPDSAGGYDAAGDDEESGAAPSRGGAAADETRDNEQHLFHAMANVHGRGHYSVFIPSSWFSRLDEETRKSLIAGFRWVVFEDLKQGLEARTDEFLSARPIHDTFGGAYDLGVPAAQAGAGRAAAPGAAGAEPLYDQAFRPGAPATLHGLVEGFGELRLNRQRYAVLIKGDSGTLDELKAVAAYLGHNWPQEDFDPNNELYLTALRQARGAPLEPRSGVVSAEFAANVGAQVTKLYERSFEQPAGGVSYAYLNDIAQTESLLSRQEYSWLATNDRVFEDPRRPFWNMTLRVALGELRKALEELSRQSFMRGGAPRQLFQRRHMVWDDEALREALALYSDFEQYEGERWGSARPRGDYADPFDDTVRRSSLTSLRDKMKALVGRAPGYEAAPRVPGRTARSTNLAAEVRELQQSQESLARLLGATERLRLDIGLRATLTRQVNDLLRDIDEEFRDARFYSTARQDFSWWRGTRPLSLPAFRAESHDALRAYLDAQRKEIAYLTRELASPVLTFASAQGIRVPAAAEERWHALARELDAYDKKQPGGSIAALEDFITKGMDAAGADEGGEGRPDCDALGRDDAGGAPDFFIFRRNELRRQLLARCAVLARDREDTDYVRDESEALSALDNYREIAAEFNRRLAGRYPFADAPGGVPLTEADPEAVLAFFDLFDWKQKAAREAIARNNLGSSGEEAVAFLDRMGQVRRFFAQYLEKRQGPFVDFQLQFRTNREMESAGARQIIDWTLDVGRRKYGLRDEELAGRWVIGEPLRLTLRWANNSPSVPFVPSDTATLRARKRVATFEFKSRWSLVALMQQQASAPGDFQYGVDTLPYTLKFVVPTRPDGNRSDVQHADLVGPEARAFMSVSLVAPGTKEPLVLPPFPAYAPRF